MPTAVPPARIGCAGWSIPRQHARHFPRGASVLHRYAQVFDGVEVNATFYRTPRAATFQRWADSVPDAFRFCLKLPRTLTHYARLRDPEPGLDAFFAKAAALGRKLGAVLAQLPPTLALDLDTAEHFFAALRVRVDPQVVVACEPRHVSWARDPALAALFNRHRVARVAADPPRHGADAAPAGTRPAYWRWHGSPRVYHDSYADVRLAALAGSLQADPGAWAIFDNTASGHAVHDALRLRAMLASTKAAGVGMEAA